jgi:hypothetical protein
MVDNFHDDNSRPDGFSSQALAAEILLSYNLLFRSDSSSRQLYKKQRTLIRKLVGATIDPVLDQECGFGQPRRATSIGAKAWQESYRKSMQFPILCDRLTELQHFAKEEQTNSLWTILRDKSDTKEWSQFVVVVIFGVVALALAVVNTGLSAVQVVFTIKTYQMGLGQPVS